tara:strand:- start:184 stop:786 length:603 start_codon:yes stop_codon:yes gene_type:complete
VTDFVIVKARGDLLSYVDALQKKHAEALSFYPRQVFEREAENGRILLGCLNGQPCGYLYFGALGGDVKCHQVCIEYDARRRLHGAALVVAMEDEARETCSRSLTLRCGFDLDANTFWREMGYTCVDTVPGGVRRNRTINVWRKRFQPALFEDIEVTPAEGRTSASLWSKHKQTGIVSQFVRGKRMKDYRMLVHGHANDPE